MEATSLPESATAGLSGARLQGAQLFETRGCLQCHQIAAVGGRRGPDLSKVGARLSPDQLTWRILNGGRNMPAYGTTLTPADTDALIAFLSGLK